METSGGSPTQMGAPERDNPLSSARREILKRLVITCGMNIPSGGREFSRPHQRNHKFRKPELRICKIGGGLGDQGPVGRRLQPTCHVTEVLFHNAFLTLWSTRQHRTQFPRRSELRILNSS